MIYKGHHQVENLDIDDGYRGSGILITRAVEKYGVENFTRETLFVYNTRKEALEKEAEEVNEEFVRREDTYNLVSGGCSPEYPSEETRKKLSESKLGEKNPSYNTHPSEETIQKLSRAQSGKNNPNYGKKHTKENRQKMRENHPDVSGSNNPMWGKKHSKEIRKKLSESRRGNTYCLGRILSEETKKKLSEANKLSKEIVKQRRIDIEKESKEYGWISSLSRKWDITPSGARCFIDKYASDLT